jgi:hypothetical protein
MAYCVALLERWALASGGRALPEFRPPLDIAVLNVVKHTLVADAKQRGLPERNALLMAYSWFSVDDWINPMISCMVEREFRAVMGWQGQVRDAAAALEEHLDRAHWLYGLSLVCDDEPLIVLDPVSGRGFRLTMSGVGDNYQLHTLLAVRLLGRGHGGLLDTARPKPQWVQAATVGSPRPSDEREPIMRRFRLFDGHGAYVYPEGWPADIVPLDGVRVLTLRPPKGDFGWMQGRSYVDMVPTLTLDGELEPADAAHWLSRIAPARETDLMGMNRD